MEYVVYTTLATSAMNFLLTIFQSIKQDHFKSTCGYGGCCTMENEMQTHDSSRSRDVDAPKSKDG